MNNELGEYDLFEQGDKKKLAKWVTPDGHVMIGSVSYAAGFDFYAASVAAGESIGLKHAENAWDETGGSCLVCRQHRNNVRHPPLGIHGAPRSFFQKKRNQQKTKFFYDIFLY